MGSVLLVAYRYHWVLDGSQREKRCEPLVVSGLMPSNGYISVTFEVAILLSAFFTTKAEYS
ncbi:MAG: hypothetical protein QS721_02890 [Candidatus Endonucleobacter sp. (ex Gigantidas childressi)]|nr:hypothetical protein [Candidatus Endonucleobacter sp. (ex Gigantidas childressi)]